MFEKSVFPYRPHWTTQTVRLLLASLMILAIVLVGLPQNTAAAASSSCESIYTVQKNDTLNRIARRFSVKFNDLVNANDMRQPYRIFVGQQLCIPRYSKVGAVGTGDTGATMALYFTIRHTKKGFVIDAVNFPGKSNYLVKIDDLSTPEVDWVKAGRLNVRKTGQAEFSYELPKDLLDANFLNICLKDQRSDALFCKYSVRYVP
jgi:LysM repeat protein